MKSKTDLRVIKTKSIIKKSFLALIKEKGYKNITVTDISKKSMINRKTFYSHYETKYVLYDEVVKDTLSVIEPLLLHKNNLDKNYHLHISQPIKILDNIKSQKLIFKLLLDDNTTNHFYNKLRSTLLNILDNNTSILNTTNKTGIPIELMKSVYCSIFIEIIKWWIHQNDATSSDAVKMMYSLFSESILNMIGTQKIINDTNSYLS